MKFRIHGMVLSLFFGLGLVFSFGMEASASHGSEGIAAGDVDPTSKADVEALLTHIVDYYNDVNDQNAGDDLALSRAIVIYGRQIRMDGGAYKDGDVYSMGINERGYLTNHAGYPGLFGYQFDPDAANSAVADTVKALIDGSDVGMPMCENYGQGRVACATKVESPAGKVTVIAGLHHAENDSAFTLPDCSNFMLDTTTAEDVYDDPTDANLEAYVKGVIKVSQELIRDITTAVFTEDPATASAASTDPVAAAAFQQKVAQRLYDQAACFGSGDCKHGNIYTFIMSADPVASTVLLNGNNFDLNGTNLELDDDELSGSDKSISGLFNRALADRTSTTVEYRWDNLEIDTDDVEDFFMNRKVPGTSLKRSYIEVANINELLPLPAGTPPVLYIFGSGIYPKDDGGAYAIAGAGHMSRSALLNLFLIASVLFSVVFLRRRV